MLATAGGIGLFLAFIGLQGSEGIGLIGYNSATLVTLGGCPLQNRVYQYSIANTTTGAICANNPDTGLLEANLGPPSSSYMCQGKRLHNASLWLGVSGLAFMVLLMGRRFKGAIMVGILFVTFISWIPYHGATYFGEASQIKGGVERFEYFKNVVAVPDARKTTLAWSFAAFGRSELWVALITFLYLDFLDATGTLFSMATMLSQRIPGFVNDKDKTFPRQLFAFCVDGIAIVIGSLLGCAPLTVYIESASGIREGGRTGITAIVVAAGFFISLFLTPLIASIPPFATGPALILVGAMMMENLIDIDWADVRQAVPAFITIVVMPLTYSIAYGVIAGVCSYLLLYAANFGLDMIDVARGKRSKEDVMYENCPDAFQDLMKKPAPFKSPSAVLQEHVNPEHAAHYAAVNKDTNSKLTPGDLPSATDQADASAK
jgi:AGZA family xanthine/uracil permease-like MFS transporter